MKRQARKEEQNRVTKRLQQLTETLAHRQQPAQPTQATPPQEIPDPDKAPLGTLKFLMNQQREVKIAQGASVQEQQRFQLTQRVMDEASRLEMDFQREQPDYGTATNSSPKYNEARAFVINIRRAELTAIGTYNPLQVSQMVQPKTLGLACKRSRPAAIRPKLSWTLQKRAVSFGAREN